MYLYRATFTAGYSMMPQPDAVKEEYTPTNQNISLHLNRNPSTLIPGKDQVRYYLDYSFTD